MPKTILKKEVMFDRKIYQNEGLNGLSLAIICMGIVCKKKTFDIFANLYLSLIMTQEYRIFPTIELYSKKVLLEVR